MAQHPPRQRPAPTAVQLAIREGYAPRAGTDGGVGGVPHQVDDHEPSVPVDMTHHEAQVYRLQRLEANDVEIARELGGVRIEFTRGLGEVRLEVSEMGGDIKALNGELRALVDFARKANEREERIELANVEAERADRAAAKAAEAQLATAALAVKAAEATAAASDRQLDNNFKVARLTSREKLLLAFFGLVGTVIAGYLALNHVTLK